MTDHTVGRCSPDPTCIDTHQLFLAIKKPGHSRKCPIKPDGPVIELKSANT